MIEDNMTDKELILNFVNQYDRPFNAESIAQMTNVSREAIEMLLPELLQSQAIKQIEDNPPIYVRTNRYQARIGYQHYKGWTFSLADAHRLLDLLEQGRYKSIREIAQVIGKSRQWVYIYLEALASIGMVGISSNGYYVITREEILKLGTIIHPGTLGKMRQESGLKPKTRTK